MNCKEQRVLEVIEVKAPFCLVCNFYFEKVCFLVVEATELIDPLDGVFGIIENRQADLFEPLVGEVFDVGADNVAREPENLPLRDVLAPCAFDVDGFAKHLDDFVNERGGEEFGTFAARGVYHVLEQDEMRYLIALDKANHLRAA